MSTCLTTSGYGREAFGNDNCVRNLALQKLNVGNLPKARSTGTTIVGLVYADGVIVAGDSRATAGGTIADKRCLKIHFLTDSIFAGGAGTAADLDQVGRMLSSNLQLLALNTGRKPRVVAGVRIARQYLYRYQGYVGAYLIIGGVDFYGPHLHNISAGGSTNKVDFIADGSGSLAALGVLEKDYRPNMAKDEAEDLLRRAVCAGMKDDLMSGNFFNYVIVTKSGVEQKSWIQPDFSIPTSRVLEYKFTPDSTTVLKKKEIAIDVIEKMDMS